MNARRRLIVSADDFGASLEVNEAVERAHREGILTTASLMVAGPYAADAVARARALPALHVGLHVVVVNGRPAAPPALIPHVVDRTGALPSDLFRAGLRYYFNPRARAQLALEIRAQFAAFCATGLHLDHANAQNHMHLHPTVAATILRVGRDYGLRAVRVPHEPLLPSIRAGGGRAWQRTAAAMLLAPWLHVLKLQLRRGHIAANDFVFGMNDSGAMTSERVLRFLRALPPGVSEIYFHPATRLWPHAESAVANYDFAGELAALVNPRVAAALRENDLEPVSFSELAVRAH